jgi:hypothetical protein
MNIEHRFSCGVRGTGHVRALGVPLTETGPASSILIDVACLHGAKVFTVDRRYGPKQDVRYWNPSLQWALRKLCVFR